jgi:hypothetical protein
MAFFRILISSNSILFLNNGKTFILFIIFNFSPLLIEFKITYPDDAYNDYFFVKIKFQLNYILPLYSKSKTILMFSFTCSTKFKGKILTFLTNLFYITVFFELCCSRQLLHLCTDFWIYLKVKEFFHFLYIWIHLFLVILFFFIL